MEAKVEVLLTTVNEGMPVKFRPCDLSKETQSLKLGMACGLDGIKSKCLRHLPRRTLAHLRNLFKHWFQLCHFLVPWKEAKLKTLPKPDRDQKFLQNVFLNVIHFALAKHATIYCDVLGW
jgi:hypothetical protein